MKEKFFNITNKNLKDLGFKNHKELWESVQKDYKGFSKEVPVTFEKEEVINKKGEKEDRYLMILSTADEDRHGEIVYQEWDLKWFKKNPVLLDSHNYSSIEKIIGKLKNIKVVDNKLKAEIIFATGTELGAKAKYLVDGGFINANSVGFIPKEFDDKGNIIKSELLEDSLVSVPANPRALFEKQLKEVEKEIEEIKEEVEETETVTKKTITALDKKQATLKKISDSLKQIKAEEVKKQKRELFQALRNLK